MSSAVLYLAIVAVWAGILVPMWLRRDGDGSGRTTRKLLHRRGDSVEEDEDVSFPSSSDEDEDVVEDPEETVPEAGAPEHVSRPGHHGRARIIARRRRRTSGLVLLTVTTFGIVMAGLVPWWLVFPPIVLLACHLALLRVAATADVAQRRAALARARRRAAEQERARVEQEVRHAEVIELNARERPVYDQYTDGRRAVGD